MKTLDELRNTSRLAIMQLGIDGGCGLVRMPRWKGSVVWSFDHGWEHVSVSPFKKIIVPTWEDMCKIKDMFFYEDETVVQFHPRKSEYVNNMPNCLHLWRPIKAVMPEPPSWMVGIKKGQTFAEVKQEIDKAYKEGGGA